MIHHVSTENLVMLDINKLSPTNSLAEGEAPLEGSLRLSIRLSGRWGPVIDILFDATQGYQKGWTNVYPTHVT